MRGRTDKAAEGFPTDPVTGSGGDRWDAFVGELRAEADHPIAAPVLRGWAAGAAALAADAAGRRGWWHRKVGTPMTVWKRRVATATSTALLLLGGASGLAWAANDSVPGNALYGLDRALERVGLGRGGASERLQEVRDLVAAGDIPGGLSHAGEVITQQAVGMAEDASQAAEALEAAAARVTGQGSEASADVRSHVAELLTYLSENIGQVDGAQVATLAHEIGGNDDPQGSGPPEGVPPVDPGTPPVGVPPVDPGTPPTSVPPVDDIIVPPVDSGAPPITLPWPRP